MRVIETPIKDLLVIELDIFKDNRGFFVERYNEDKFKALGLPISFIQDNHSFSYPKVIRGLHAQQNPTQGKLVGVARGSVLDVAVDARFHSPTFGKYFSIELNESNGKLLWIPKGFLHGFCVLGDEPADFFYKVDGRFAKDGEIGVRWDDPEIAIDWPVKDPIVSDKDRKLESFVEFKAKNVIC